MASVRCSSELMTNYFSAAAITTTSVASVWDPVMRQPAVFTLSGGEHPQLELTKTNAAGKRVKTPLNDRIGIPEHAYIQAFGLRQDSKSVVYLVLATKTDDNRSELWVLRPFEISHELDLHTLGHTQTGSIHGIRVGLTDVPGRQFPTVWILSQPVSRTTSGSDVGRLEVSMRDSSLVIWQDLSLPVNAQNILDIAPSSFGAFGQGLYFLYENQGSKGLLAKFVRPGDEPGDGGKWAQFRMQCPANATSIASLTDFNSKSKNSALILGADDGLYYYPSDSTAENPMPTLLTKAKCFAGASDLCISQDEKEISIWARNRQDELGYLVGTIDALKKSRTATLLGPGRAAAFDSLICRKEWHGSSMQTLLATDKLGNLTMLQQSLVTGIWREESFYVEADGDLVPVQSYTVHLTAVDDKGLPLRNGQIKLKSSSVQSVTVNGRLETFSSLGTWCELDLQGELALIAQTPGVTIQPLEIVGIKTLTGDEVAITGEKVIDPSKKVIDRFSDLTSESGLKNAMMPGGEKSLWHGQDHPSDADLKVAAQCFQAIADGHTALPSDGSAVNPAPTPAPAPVHEVRIMASGIFDEVKEFFMDGFHYIKEKIEDVKDWVVRQANNVWEFACTLGNELKVFVLDCVEKVTEAASWVWEKMKLGWEKLCEFAGFLFSWQDILDTKTSIKGMINSGFDFAAIKIESVNDKIESFFDDLDKRIGKAIGIVEKQDAKAGSSRDYQGDKEMTEAKDSPVTKWIGERLRNGNRSMTGKASKDPAQIDLFQDRVVPLIMSVVDLVETLAKDIQALFRSQDSMTVEQMLKKTGGDFLTKALKVVKDTLKLIVTSIAKLVLLIKDLANAELTSGFLNSLWRFLNQGSNLSILDAVCLMIAIPSTFIIKLVTFARPPKLDKIDQSFFDGTPSKEQSVILLGATCGVAVIKYEFNGLKLIYKLVTQGVTGGVSHFTPGAIIEIMSMVIDAWSIYKDLTEPERDEGWIKDVAFVCTIVKACRLMISALNMAAGGVGLSNKEVDEAKEVFDVLAALVVFGLDTGVFVGDMIENDEKGTAAISAVNTLLDTVSSVGYYVANEFKDKEELTAAVGLAVCQAAAQYGIVTKGVEFRLRYQELEESEVARPLTG